MSTATRHWITTAILLAVFTTTGHTQQRSSAAVGINTMQAPVPSPLVKGKKAFISYELGDVTSFPSRYSGGPERAYSEFFNAMKSWGRYELVGDPAEADVVFAIGFVDPPEIAKPQVRVGILDSKTHTALWGFVEQVDFAFRKKNRDAAFSDTVDQLAADVRHLVEP
ncbi:hypothetical protein [Granulicella sibirica]|uniref:Uncharacterized protein n=1 Tax=Granulicella sibirica TaxID=2479048 RepID=A0A4Q0SWD2_9BACT|nr:hypothetical protein [Granulicella sibirica]RXH55097.1 hypothetical protein GRAN_4201 [Granulicella sibirica]